MIDFKYEKVKKNIHNISVIKEIDGEKRVVADLLISKRKESFDVILKSNYLEEKISLDTLVSLITDIPKSLWITNIEYEGHEIKQNEIESLERVFMYKSKKIKYKCTFKNGDVKFFDTNKINFKYGILGHKDEFRLAGYCLKVICNAK